MLQRMPILTEQLRAMVADCNPDTMIGLRDRAALLLAFAGALRRSEVGGSRTWTISTSPARAWWFG